MKFCPGKITHNGPCGNALLFRNQHSSTEECIAQGAEDRKDTLQFIHFTLFFQPGELVSRWSFLEEVATVSSVKHLPLLAKHGTWPTYL